MGSGEREKGLCSPDFLNLTQFDCFVRESGVKNPTLEGGGERGVVGWGGINGFLQ